MRFVAYEPAPNEKRPDLVVVDLGFSEKLRSCGFLGPGDKARAERLSFGEMLEKVAATLAENRGAILVIEAPLSGRFDKKGNPCPREPFEREPKPAKPATKKKTRAHPTRGWYHGAGAAVALGAQRLLSELRGDPRLEKRTVYLAEAFLTRVDGALRDDAAAALIHKKFRPEEGVTVEFAVSLVPGLEQAPRIWRFSSSKRGPK